MALYRLLKALHPARRFIARHSAPLSSEGKPQPKIYISYRNADAPASAARIFDKFAATFGSQNVLFDVSALAPGINLTQSIREEVEASDVTIVVIGPGWLEAKSKKGSRCLDSASDIVRMEIAFALAAEKPILPVLVEGAEMPALQSLPESLRPLAMVQHFAIGHTDFHRDMEMLAIMLRERASGRAPQIVETSSKPVSAFISHASADRKWMIAKVIQPLRVEGIRPWFSSEAIRSSTQWEREILKGLESCDWFCVVVSEKSATSDWVRDELFWAMQYRPARIIPIIKVHCDLYRFHIRLPRLHFVDLSQSSAVEQQKLIDLLRAADLPAADD